MLLPEQRFDLIILILCLGVELVDMFAPLRTKLIEPPSDTSHQYLDELIEILFARLEEAQKTDAETDKMLDAHQGAGQLTEAMQETLLERGKQAAKPKAIYSRASFPVVDFTILIMPNVM